VVPHTCVNKLVNSTLIPWLPNHPSLLKSRLEALTHDVTQTQADLHETKEKIKEISCQESTAEENASSS